MPSWPQPPLPARFAVDRQAAFVGRRRELDQLDRIWDQVELGRRQAVFIGGEPGSGKSRLAYEVARALHDQGVVVLLGTTSADLGYPYQPMVEALDHLLLTTPPGELRHLMAQGAAELVRLTPHVRRHSPDLDDPTGAATEHRRAMFDAYCAVLASVARERPTALVLEDLHWSTAPSRLLLSHLIRSADDVPLLVLGTMRSTAPDRSDELGMMIADLYRSPGISRIDLAGLDAADIEALLRSQGSGPGEHLRETAALLRDQTGGNPFFVQEMWHHMARSGEFLALRSGTVTAPPTVRDALEARIKSFGDDERAVLEVAAVAGDTFDVADIATATGLARPVVLAALDTAIESGLVRNAGRVTSFTFEHALVRQAVLARLGASRSAELHAALAGTIETRLDVQPHLATTLARLYGGAESLGYEEKALLYLRKAASDAEQGLAHEEAGELWERAARLVTTATERHELLLRSASSHVRAGEFADARRIYREIHRSADARTALRAAIGFEDASWRPGLFGQEAHDLIIAALDLVEPDPFDPWYVRAVTALGRAHTFMGRLDRAREIAGEALELARASGDQHLIGNALAASLLPVMTAPATDDASYARALELREIAVRSGQYDGLGPAGAYLAFASYVNGNITGWHDGWDDIRIATAKTAQPFWEWVVGCYEHCHQFMLGEFRRAEETAERMRELGYTFGTDDTEGPYGLQMYMVRRETGELEAARHLIQGDPSIAGSWRPGLLALYTELGFNQQAHRLLTELLDELEPQQQREAIWPASLVFLVEAATRLRDRDAAAALLPLVDEYSGRNLVAGQCVAVFGSADRYLGQIHEVLGDLDRSEAHFERALDNDRATRSVVHQGETLANFASMLRRRCGPGDMDRSTSLAAAAHDLATPIGHRRVLDALAVGQPTRSGFPDGLTNREIDVLRLVAKGASNKEIGESLFISQNTAANHVRSILTKTGASNRTQAAIYATDHDLLG